MKILIRLSTVILQSSVMLALMVILRSSLPRTTHPGLLVFTDYRNYRYSVDMFDLEQDRRFSLSFEAFEDIGALAYIDEKNVYIEACLATNNPLSCTAYVREIVPPDTLEKFKIVKQSWNEDYSTPVWSPDGTRIAFIFRREGNSGTLSQGDIYVMDADGTNMLDLTPNEDNNGFSFTWSPDSQKLAFACLDEQYLCIANADGSNLQQIDIPKNTKVSDLSWSPNGNQIVLVLLRRDYRNSELYVVNANGSHMFRLLEAGFDFHESPVWSPDGSKIAFRSRNNIGEIYVIEPDGTNLHNLSQILDGNEFTATWSPDSTRIAFFSHQYKKGLFLYITNSDGTGLQRITENSTWEYLDADSPVLFWLG